MDLVGADARLSDRVARYVRDRIDSLVSVEGDLSLTATTRETVYGLVEFAIRDGWDPSELARAIEEDTVFDAERADVIAETELSAAKMAGGVESMAEAGVKFKVWVIDDSVHGSDDDCDDNADAGAIGIDETFPSGDDAPPAHPYCACEVYGVGEEGGEDEGD